MGMILAVALAGLLAGSGLAYGQAKTEKGDPPAGTSYSVEPRKPDRGMTDPTAAGPPSVTEQKGGVKSTGQPEAPNVNTTMGNITRA